MEERARQLLRAARLRVTGSRTALVTAMLRHPEPASMEDAVKLCGRQGGDPATVWRNLLALCEAGVLQTVRGVGKREMYEIAHHAHQHAHVSCTRCGKVECVEIEKLPKQPPAPKGWHLNDVSVTVWGLCPECSS
ncbi:MAG: transcriptional repressor [Planctomycetes bacterium]|nr:transcriptional repressor [Planctomycetota bacterium]MCW8136590.1 transcriptional repressor [Planctomycetota bacterium]